MTLLKSGELKERLRAESTSLGFELFGVASAQDTELAAAANRYDTWIANGMHASMQYLERHRAKKFKPELFFESARAVVVVGIVYSSPSVDAHNRKAQNVGPRISQYTAGADYHERVMARVEAIATKFRDWTSSKTRCFVDIEPVAERFWGVRAGLGWIGKNAMLINRKFGSYFFIGGFYTDFELPMDQPDTDHCGRCQKCIEACPTEAITDSRTIDARKCIGYHTIENRGEVEPGLASKFQGWIAGCDICQMVCPWNDPLIPTKAFETTNPMLTSSFAALEQVTELEFKSTFKGYAMERMKYAGFKRNLKNAKESL